MNRREQCLLKVLRNRWRRSLRGYRRYKRMREHRGEQYFTVYLHPQAELDILKAEFGIRI